MLAPSLPIIAEIVFRGSLSWWIIIPLLVLGVTAVSVVYWRESMKIDPARRIIMGVLRGLAIVFIILLLKKPVIVSEGNAYADRPIALLVDNTQSMRQRDPRPNDEDLARVGIARDIYAPDHGLERLSADRDALPVSRDDRPYLPSRAEIVMAAFQNPRLNLREELRKKGPLQEYLFGAALHGAGKDWEKSLPAGEAQTALLYSITQLLERDDTELPAAIVIATDGIDNDKEHRLPWEEVARECARLKIPLHIYGVGGGAARMLRLKSVDSNPRDTLVVKDTVRVVFRWTCQGIKEGKVELNVNLGGKNVATKRVDVKEGEEITEVLSFVPTEENASAGKLELEGTIHLVGAPETEKDRIARNVRVVESKVKLLYVERTPRWEFKFLLQAFKRDRIVEPSFVLIEGDDRTLKAGPPFLPNFPKDRKDFFAYDMLIIGDVDAGYFTAEQKKWIVEFVEEGGGLVMIAGRQHNPSSYLDNPVGRILPVEFEVKKFPIDDARRPVEFFPKLSAEGAHDVMMSLADTPQENLEVWAKLPGWYWNYPVTKLKPAAQTLLEHPKETIEDPSPLSKNRKLPMPLIARQYYGRGLVLFMASDETWRWRYNEADKYFGRFWGQVVYQVGLPHVLGGKSQLVAESDFFKGKPTKVYARLFTADHRPVDHKRIPGTLEPTAAGTGDRGESVFFEPVEGQPGLYMTTITKNQTGDYNLRIGDSGTNTAALPIRVSLTPEDELAPGNMNEAGLRQLAEQTGGAFYREENLKDLGKNIQSKSMKRDPPPRHEVLLWTRWYTIVIVIGLLTAEWLVRKFSNLS